MNTYYVVLVNGVPEAVTTHWARAKQAADELGSVNREARIVPCVEALPFLDVEETPDDFADEEPTIPETLSFGSTV